MLTLFSTLVLTKNNVWVKNIWQKNWAEFNQPPTNDIYTAPRLGVSGAMVFNELLSIELAPEGAPQGGVGCASQW